MKRIYWIILIACLIVIGFIAYFFRSYGLPQHQINPSVAVEYPILNNKDYFNINNQILDENEVLIKGGIINIGNKTIAYTPSGIFSCNGKDREKILYEDYKNPSSIGGYYSTYVIDCDTEYWVYTMGDAGPRLYGPFVK